MHLIDNDPPSKANREAFMLKPGPGFNCDPDLKHPIGKDYAIVCAELVYTDRQGRRHIAHKGFCTDGASIPRFFWRLIGHPFDSDYLAAAIIHDKYYAEIAVLPPTSARRLQKAADDLFLEMLTTLDVGKAKRRVMYRVVRIFGAAAIRDGARRRIQRKIEGIQLV